MVPLELGALRILKQQMQEDGSIEVEVIATIDRARCPHCQRVSVKVHDTRPRRKRDLPLRGHRIVLVLFKRRFRCLTCRRSFTEADQACGKQACSRPVSHVAAEMQVGPRLVQTCLEEVAQRELATCHLTLDETAPLPTPRYVGIDEFARRKGHRSDAILCDLYVRRVLEVSAERTKKERLDAARTLSKLVLCATKQCPSRPGTGWALLSTTGVSVSEQLPCIEFYVVSTDGFSRCFPMVCRKAAAGAPSTAW